MLQWLWDSSNSIKGSTMHTIITQFYHYLLVVFTYICLLSLWSLWQRESVVSVCFTAAVYLDGGYLSIASGYWKSHLFSAKKKWVCFNCVVYNVPIMWEQCLKRNDTFYLNNLTFIINYSLCIHPVDCQTDRNISLTPLLLTLTNNWSLIQ